MAPLVGTEAVAIFADVNPDELNLVRDILRVTYGLYLGDAGRSFIDASFVALTETLEDDDWGRLDQVFADRREAFARAGLDVVYRQYKRGSLQRTAKLLSLRGFDGHIVDIGAGTNLFGWMLAHEMATGATVTGVDIARAPDVREAARLRFVQQQDPTTVPLDDGSADLCLLRFSLHHMEPQMQGEILAETRRLAKPEGRVVIVEDSWSPSLPALADNALHRRVLALGERVPELLSLLDASSCLWTDVPMPFTFSFRPIEAWLSLASSVGLQSRSVDYWGLPFFSLLQAQLAILDFFPTPVPDNAGETSGKD